MVRSNNKGFTLIEILVALIVFAFGAIVVARMQVTSLRGSAFGKEAMTATTAAQALIEELKDRGVHPDFNYVLAGGGPTAVDSTHISGMTRAWASSATGGVAGNRYTTVTVTIAWNGRTQTYTTMILEKPDPES